MNKNQQIHIPVMLKESIDYLNIKSDGIYFDGTLGDGGHSTEIYKKLGSGILISVDLDKKSIEYVKTNNQYAKMDNWKIIEDNFKNIKNILTELNFSKIDGAILDLGLSSRQIKDKSRGFSYYSKGSLDMRMSENFSIKAFDLLNVLNTDELTQLFTNYGEEKYSKQIARNIVLFRRDNLFHNVDDLLHVIYKSIPSNYDRGRKHPAKRIFQALRIAVNDEIYNLKEGLNNIYDCLNKNSKIVVLCYHSLETKTVEDFIKSKSNNEIVPVFPSTAEIEKNTRAMPAKLYVITKNEN